LFVDNLILLQCSGIC